MAKPKLPKRVNLGDVKANSEGLAVGLYHAKIVKVDLKENNAKDGYYLNFELVVVSEGPGKGRHIWDIASLKENALWKLKSILDAVGIDTDGSWDIEDKDDLVGELVDIVVGEEEYQGEMRPKVKRIKPSSAPSLADLASEEEDEGDEEDDESELYDEDELNDMDLSELKEIAAEFDLTFKKGTKKPTIIAAILEAQEGDEDEEDEEDEDDSDSDDEDDDEDEDDFDFDDEDEDDEEPEPAPKKATKKVAPKRRK